MIRSLFVVLLAIAGCGSTTVDPCEGVPGPCIGLRVEGTASGLDQLAITLDQKTLRTPDPARTFDLPVKIALSVPQAAAGPHALAVDGFAAGSFVARDEKQVTLPASGRAQITLRLDGGAASQDLASASDDLAVNPGLNISGPDAKTLFELDPLDATFTGFDTEGSPVVLTATGVPSTATFSATGGDARLTWTPSVTESGAYPITLTATSSDSSRQPLSRTFMLTVLNHADKLPNPSGGGGLPALMPIGDFDKDGYADFVACNNTSSASVSPTFTLTVYYGDATGLPHSSPWPPARVKAYTFTYGAPGTTANPDEVVCQPGTYDFDGDGYADVLMADPNNSSRTGLGQSGILLAYFGTARTSGTTTVVPTYETGAMADEHIGSNVIAVGDYNGDSIADFAFFPPVGPVVLNIFEGTRGSRPTTWNEALTFTSSQRQCGQAFMVGMGDLDGDGNSEVLFRDPATGQTGSACDPAVRDAKAGVRVLKGGSNPVVIAQDLAHPAGKALDFGGYSALCDVDRDGKDDLVVNDKGAIEFFWGSATYLMNPLDPVNATTLTLPVLTYGIPVCARRFLSQATLLMPVTDCTTSRIDAVFGGDRMPKVDKMLSSPEAADRCFNTVRGTTDVNGDGKNDITVPSMTTLWVIYGR
jgi:hypothetical protein